MATEYRVDEIRQINLEMAGGCNLRCPMCPQSFGREKDFLRRLPLEEFKKIIDQAIPHGLKHVTLSGSGEPLLHTGLEDAVRYLSERGVGSLIYTNGTRLTPERFERLCQAGLTVCKVSCQGWDRESYAKWMSQDAFDQVREYLKAAIEILKVRGYPTMLQTNHLIHDYEQRDLEISQYMANWIDYLGVKGEIWLSHNWAGQYGNDGVKRDTIFQERRRRSCGRPLGPVIEIRAGGLNGKHGAVVPCPYVLGMDSKAVMGHTEDTPLMDIVNGAPMQALRAAHLRGDFDAFDYCKNCDQLLDVQESLVWTNIEGRTYGTSRVSLLNYLDYVPKDQQPDPAPAA
jgi:pyruvate-formate lyase-activating enzyme